MRRPVLCATDFSPASRPAVRAAVAWARRAKARLEIVHVILPPSPFLVEADTPTPGWQALQATARRAAMERLRRLQRAARAAGLRVAVHLRSGSPHEEIARLARRRGAGLIVMGTHGRTGLRRAVTGSVAARVLRAAACPVLTVRAS